MDTSQWDNFVGQHYRAVYRYCYHFLGSEAEAEDAVQKAFLKAWRSFSKLKEPDAGKSWIYSIARNVCIDRTRWWKRTKELKENLSSSRSVANEPELSLTLRRLIAQLPTKQREVFILRHFHEFSTTETARFLGISDGTVKSHLKRAVDSLKEELTELGYATSKRSLSNALPTESIGEASRVSEEGIL